MKNKQTISQPNAHICINKSRMKVYKNVGNLPTYYLQKGQEFSIELANPTTNVVLAKVILNGKAISQGGLVLNPGQRVYLERYLDVAKKFLFDTYEVSGSAEMKAAIANNGDIRVEFYKERQPYFNQYNGMITIANYPPISNLGNYNGSNGTNPQFLRSSLTDNAINTGTASGVSGNIDNTTTTTSSSAYFSNYNVQNAGMSYTSSVGPDMFSMDMDQVKSIPEPSKKIKSRSLSKQNVETGRVEMGSHSDQEIKYVNKIFEYSPFYTVEYKMLPESQKVNTAEDVNVRVYCVNCGAKLGKTDRFCGSCGCKK